MTWWIRGFVNNDKIMLSILIYKKSARLYLFSRSISDALVSWKGVEENWMGLLFHIFDEDAIKWQWRNIV